MDLSRSFGKQYLLLRHGAGPSSTLKSLVVNAYHTHMRKENVDPTILFDLNFPKLEKLCFYFTTNYLLYPPLCIQRAIDTCPTAKLAMVLLLNTCRCNDVIIEFAKIRPGRPSACLITRSELGWFHQVKKQLVQPTRDISLDVSTWSVISPRMVAIRYCTETEKTN